MRARSLLGFGAVIAICGLPATAQAAPTSCAFPNGQYKHVVEVQFDNTHLMRDNPNVPSDLEQIPALKSFVTSNGTLLDNDHTILISHTAGGIVSTLTGLYPDRNGINVSNSYQFFAGNPTATNFASAFSYWTDPVGSGDSLPNLVTTGGVNTPAPWVPFTRAGCDFGAVATADVELENTSTSPSGDITRVFGGGVSGLSSPQAAIATKDRPAATTDLEGVAIHCAQASPLCSSVNGGVADTLPAEPGGYAGFNGLFGALYANQVLARPGVLTPATTDTSSPTFGGHVVPTVAPPVMDVYGYHASPGIVNPPSQVVGPGPGKSGFPGFDPTPAQALGYVAAMQEAGVPVTFAYIADAHDNHAGGPAFGPGQQGYVDQLRDYNRAFTAFFDRLAQDHIDRSNTLFVFTVDEGDHFAGGPPTNPGCDGVTVACDYTPGGTGPDTVGEQDVDLVNALAREAGNTTPFDVHADDAPTVYVHGAPAPGANDPSVRQLERDTAALTLQNARTGRTDPVTQHIADQIDESLLHMVNVDPARTPTFTLFGNPDYFFEQEGPFGYTCADPHGTPGCPVVDNGFAWNHGDDNPEIARTWIGYVGPTVRNLGETAATWTDHTDARPTILEALGLSDSYAPDGRVVSQVLDPNSLPAAARGVDGLLLDRLGAAYKQLDAPFGSFGQDSEVVSTAAVRSVSPGDAVYRAWDAQLQTCGTLRDAVAGQIRAALQGAEFGGRAIPPATAAELTVRADLLTEQMHLLARRSSPPVLPACLGVG